jgi:hypothetical protein
MKTMMQVHAVMDLVVSALDNFIGCQLLGWHFLCPVNTVVLLANSKPDVLIILEGLFPSFVSIQAW